MSAMTKRWVITCNQNGGCGGYEALGHEGEEGGDFRERLRGAGWSVNGDGEASCPNCMQEIRYQKHLDEAHALRRMPRTTGGPSL